MCLIVHRTKFNTHITEEIITYNKWLNPDGFGLAWRDSQLRYERFGPDDFSKFRELLVKIDDMSVEYVAHFRKATHGDACLDLSHPYPYKDKSGKFMLAFHNGILDIKTYEGESDTLAFVKRVLAKLEHGWWKNSDQIRRKVISDCRGQSS